MSDLLGIARHFPSSEICPFGMEREFFNSHEIFQHLSLDCRLCREPYFESRCDLHDANADPN